MRAILFFILPPLFAYSFIIFSNQYYQFYDLGVNQAANSGWLIDFIFPLALILFAAESFAISWISRKRNYRVLVTVCLLFLLQIVLFALLFYVVIYEKPSTDIDFAPPPFRVFLESILL